MKIVENLIRTIDHFASSHSAADDRPAGLPGTARASRGLAGSGRTAAAPPSVSGSSLTSPADPLFAALVDLFLPERDALLQLVDRVLARGERVLAVRGGDGDHDGGLADRDASDTVMDGDGGQLVPSVQPVCDLGHHLFRHSLIRFVVEVDDGSTARGSARRPGEGRDRTRVVGAHLVDDAVEGERFVAEQERATGDRRDQRHLVAVRERRARARRTRGSPRRAVRPARRRGRARARRPRRSQRRSRVATSPRARAGRRRGAREPACGQATRLPRSARRRRPG